MRIPLNPFLLILSFGFITFSVTKAKAQCPTEAQLESGSTLNIPTSGDCSSAVNCSVNVTGALRIDGNFTVESCVTLDLNQNSGFIRIDAGTFIIDEGATVNTNRRLVVQGANLIVNGTLNIGDGAGTDNLAIQGGGTITVGASGVLDVGNGNIRVGTSGAGTGDLVVDGSLSTSGDVVINTSGGLSGDGLVTYAGTFTNSGSTSDSFTSCADGSNNDSCGQTTLPVKLLVFNVQLADQSTSHLHWETASEINNEGFYIEKSTDGLWFEEIGFVDGNGTTDQLQIYDFYDESLSTNSYYRLRQVDYDGQFEYSPIAYQESATNKVLPKVGIYPNPVVSAFQFTANMEGVFDWTMVSITGQKILSEHNLTVAQAEVAINQSLHELNPGQYIIVMQNAEGRQLIKMLKR